MTAEDIKTSILSAYRAEKENELRRKKAQREEEAEKAVGALTKRLNDAKEAHRKALEQSEAKRNEAAGAAAIYSELRGDRGGIGKAEFMGAYSDAAADRREINAALASEKQAVDESIEEKKKELARADEEDESKAASDISAKESELAKWTYEKAAEEKAASEALALKEAALTGQYKGEQTAEERENETSASAKEEKETRESLREACYTLLQKGIMPSVAQLEAAGITEEQAKEYIAALQLSGAKAGSSGGVSTGGNLGTGAAPTVISNPGAINSSGKILGAY